MILFAALLLAWSPSASPVASQIPVVLPESLGYEAIEPPTLDDDDPKKSAYIAVGDEYAATPLAKAYGPIEEFTTVVTVEAILQSAEKLEARLAASSAFAVKNGPRFRKSLAAELKAYKGRIASRPREAPDLGNPFQRTTRPRPADVPPSDDLLFSEVVYFEGRPTQIVLRRFKPGTDSAGARSLKTVYYATPDQAVEIRAVFERLDAIAAKLMTNELHSELIRLSSINRGWKNYLEHGFSQYPWESYFNGYVTPLVFGESSWYDPPNDQVVFMHPEVGVLADLRTRDGASAEMALLVHGIGYIRYFGDENCWYAGASATVSLSDSDFGLGIGPTIHFGDSGRHSTIPNFSIGLLWHDFDDGGTNPALAITMDLSRLLDKEGPEGVFRAALTPPAP